MHLTGVYLTGGKENEQSTPRDNHRPAAGKRRLCHGQGIAEHFGFEYIDKEILTKAAAILDADEENLELLDENVSVLTAMARSAALEMPYMAREWYIPTSDQLFKTQTDIMRESVEKGAVRHYRPLCLPSVQEL